MNKAAKSPAVHPLFLRVVHWSNAFAVIVMILSGWRIYNAAPLYSFEFPAGFTIGGWLAGALAWHFAAMWLLGAGLFAYLVYGVATGHFRRRFLPLSPSAVRDDLLKLLRGQIIHEPGRYNAAQRFAYVLAILAIVVAILSGLAIWKPVQLQELTALMGGYERARRVHFYAMSALVLFIVVHVSFAIGVKGLLRPMVTGRLENAP